MNEVENIFRPSTKNIFTLFSENGVLFQIPSYQRNYAWSDAELKKLIQDVAIGYSKEYSEGTDQTLCFLGSIITVNINEQLDVVSCPLNIVDGQQRLTSTLLLISIIDSFLKEKFEDIKDSIPQSLSNWLEDELKELHRNTRKTLFEDKDRDKAVYDLLPKITREYVDILGFRKNNFQYESPVAKYLKAYANFIFESRKVFQYIPESNDENLGLKNALKVFKASISEDSFLSDCNISIDRLLSEDKFYSLSAFDKNVISTDISNVAESLYFDLSQVMKVISFSKFLFFNVVITEVRTHEKYQFDAFEALNTSGVPLTAIDIFRAKVLSGKGAGEAISSNDIQKLDNIEKYSLSISVKSRTKEIRELVSSFVLYLDGITPNEHLSWQRNKLIELYNDAFLNNRVSHIISALEEITLFRKNFWNEKTLAVMLDELDERDELLAYFYYFKQLNSTLLVPILTRIYNLFYGSENVLFCKYVKALASFVLLWRLSHSNTSGIDDALRGLMSGSLDRSPFSKGLCNDNEILSIEDFKSYLFKQLEKKKISNFIEWNSKCRGVQIYNVSKPTARFALLLAHHKSSILNKETALISKEKVKLREDNDLLNFNCFKNPRYKTLEHIAPQNLKDAKDWDGNIYSGGEILANSLGNLTLLPQAENDAIGNNRWGIKKLYLDCFVAGNESEVDIAINILKKQGIAIRKPVVQMMNQNHSLGILVTSLLSVDNWNKEVIEGRQQNLCEILWTECAEQLSLPPDIN